MRRFVVPILAAICLLAPVLAAPSPAVTNVTAPDSVGQYEKLEVSFDVSTTATNNYWPYDPAPAANTPEHPNAVPAGVGVSVDGLFLPPGQTNWSNAIVQPAFYAQMFHESGGSIVPDGGPCWKIRFSPTSLGVWKYRIRVTDSSGTTTSSESQFTCLTSSSRGFVRVSPNDCRYFETSDGRYLPLVGISYCAGIPDSDYATYGANGINLIRPWWNASQGPVIFGLSGQGGLSNWNEVKDGAWGQVHITGEQVRQGELFSGRIYQGTSTAIITSTNVKPSTTYRFGIWVKTVSFQVSSGGGAYLQANNCTQRDVPLTAKITGNTDWVELVGTLTTVAGQTRIDYLKLTLDKRVSGTLYYTDWSLKENLSGGAYGPNVVAIPSFNKHTYVSQIEAYTADRQVELARQNGIYLKIVLEEKDDICFGNILANGTAGSYWYHDPNLYTNVRASLTHASRTYQQYLWRYIIARYGYATSIHSFDFLNEDDPFDSTHHAAAEALAKCFKDYDPNRHLVTTSNWHSYPTSEFWGNPSYPSIGYSDWHQYIGKQTGSALQYRYGWDYGNTTGTTKMWLDGVNTYLDTSTYYSAPASLYVNGDGYAYGLAKNEVSISPGHTYTIRWKMKGLGLTKEGSHAGSPAWILGPTMMFVEKSGWWSVELNRIIPTLSDNFGTYDWTDRSYTFTALANARYITLQPTSQWAVGQVWFDDITIHDDTANVDVAVLNGNFDTAIYPETNPSGGTYYDSRLDFDTAIVNYSIGAMVGTRQSRAKQAPCIRGELGISGDNVYGSPYKGFTYVGENQQFVDDTNGIWYKKLIWGHLNHFGVIDMYWWRENIMAKGLYKYSKAYQTFMADIPLSNGSYQDIAATVSNPKLRVLGQKDLVHNRAHLWVDNSNHTWKNVVDGAAIPAVSGTVTISGLQDGTYRLESWNTSTGVVQGNSNIECTGGNIVLTISDLATDTAFKIYPGETAPPTGSIIINSDAPGTNSRLVTLTLSAIDSGSGVASMRLSNDMAIWTGWEAYSTARDWTLSVGDGTKSVFVQYVDVAGNTSPVYEDTILVDSSPPSGAITINSGAAYTGEPGVEITILAIDSASGVAQMRFSNDATTWTVWEAYNTSKSWTLATGEGSKIVYAQFMDGAGNTSRSFMDTILLDSTPPTGQVTINSGDAYTSSVHVQLTLSASDAGSGVAEMRFSNDGTNWDSWKDYSTTASWDVTSGAGQKTVYAQFKDHADRVSNSCTDTITLDDSPPTGSIVINSGDATTNSTSAILTLSATDTGSGISQMRFSNDETTWSAWETYGVTKAWTLTSGDGTKTVYAQFKDVSGNASSSYSDSIQLSTTMPGSSVIINSGAAFTNSTSASLALADGGWGATNMRFSNDGTSWSSWESYKTSKTWTLSSGQGTKTVRAQFRDGSGNSSTPCSDAIVLDTAAPSGSVTINSGAAYSNTTSVTLALSATDAGSGLSQMRFSSNGTTWNAWESYAASKSWTLSTGDGTKTAYVQFKDGAGNSSTSQSDTIVLDTAAPSGSITIDAGAQYATMTSVTLTLSATDAGSGLSQMRFSNDGTNWSAWDTYATTKSWTLTSGDGTKTVNAQLKDRAGNASSSPSDTIILATSGPTGTVNINSGAQYTRTTSVALTISAGGGAGVSQMRFSSDGVSWSSWQTYATSRNWTLTSGDGTKTVSAQFKDAAGNVSDNATDTIILKTTAPTVTIADPTTDADYRTNHPLLTICGTASDDVSTLTWSTGAGASGDCAGTTVWSTDEIVFAVGANVITVTAWDAAGNSSMDTVTLHYIDARIPSTWTGLRMVSIPIIPDEPDPKPAVGFDQNAWCIFRPEINNYVVYANDPSRLTWFDPAYATPGRGFWARFAGEAKTPLGQVPAQDQPVAIHLYRGWNIVGQPFLAPVRWSLTGIHVQEAGMGPRLLRDAWDVVDDYAIGWDQINGRYYVVYDSSLFPGAVDTLTPWMAYWVKAYKDCDLILPPPTQ